MGRESVGGEEMNEQEPTQDDIIDALAKASHHKRCRTLEYLYNRVRDAKAKAATIYQDTIADEMEARIKSETALNALRKRLKEIEDYLLFRCKQTCAGREGYQGKLKHEPDCPAYDLGLVDS